MYISESERLAENETEAAIRNGNIEYVRNLLMFDVISDTLIWYAVLYERVEIIKLLLDDPRVTINNINVGSSLEIKNLLIEHSYKLDKSKYLDLSKLT